MKADVLIIGGGLAGLAAAYETASRGLQVALVDESWSLGGQLRQQTQILEGLPDSWQGLRGYELAQSLIGQLASLPVDTYLEHAVIGLYADGRVGVSNGEEMIPVQAEAVIVATGAAEKAVAFPGWTLPGIMTIGAAQILINRERVLPGKRTVVVGTSDFAFEAVKQMVEVGIDVAAMVESQDQPVSGNLELVQEVVDLGVPIHYQSRILEAKGRGKVEQVQIGSVLEEKLNVSAAVDFVAVDGGREPILETFTMFQCELAYQSALGGWLPAYDQGMETRRTGVFAAGSAAGVCPQASILCTGSIAGLSAAERLGKLGRQESLEQRMALWDRIYQWESERCPDLWEARVAHMESFLGTSLPRNPKQWMKVST